MIIVRPNIPDELYKQIDEKIYLDLEVHILNKRFIKAEKEGNSGFATYIENLIIQTTNKRKEVNDLLKNEGVKIYDPVADDDFVEYKFYQKKSGGIAEGSMRYWKPAMKLNLKNRMSVYWK